MKRIWSAYVIKRFLVIANIVAVVLVTGCSSGPVNGPTDTLQSGSIHISADESFKPVIDSQIKVFESQNPDAKIIVHYKPEAECLRDLNVDSIRMVIVTRGLTAEEDQTLKQRLSFSPYYGPMAYDAIAVIVNNRVKDTLFTMQDIRSLAKGTSGFPYKVLLDGTSATSTVRYVVDSLLRGAAIGKNIAAAANSEAVIDYISKNTDAVGMIGVSWLGNSDDSTRLSFMKKVKIASIECRGCNGTYVEPVQYNIAANRYPMIRELNYILKENFKGLGSGFKNFLISEKGQLIFSRAYLVPSEIRFEVRKVEISQ